MQWRSIFLFLALLHFADASLTLRSRGIVTKGGLEGVACTDDEYQRYRTIVCKIEKTCGCADTRCELDWCSEYVHNWKKEFGACNLKGCEAGGKTADEPKSEENE